MVTRRTRTALVGRDHVHPLRWPVVLLVVSALAHGTASADWPTYRSDNARSGVNTSPMTADLAPAWTHKLAHAPRVAWPAPSEERHRMDFDRAFFTTSAEGLVFFGSSVDDHVYALDAATGELRWSFATDGPVRLAPSYADGRLYVGSDDGYVYCLSAKDGTCIWNYRPGPNGERVIGNGRMISRWPLRASILVDDGVAYLAAGVFPYEGQILCALDARTGAVIWRHDTLGDRSHDHRFRFQGITPQGYLLAGESILYVPSGRAMPAAFDRKTGQFLYNCSPPGKVGGAWALLVGDDLIAGVGAYGEPAKVLYDGATGKCGGDAFAYYAGIDLVVGPTCAYILTDSGIVATDRKRNAAALSKTRKLKRERDKHSKNLYRHRRARYDAQAELAKLEKAKSDEKDKEIQAAKKKLAAIDRLLEQDVAKMKKAEKGIAEAKKGVKVWDYPASGLRSIILAGDVVFAGGENIVVGLDAKTGNEVFRGEVDGRAEGLMACDNRLVVSTNRGVLHGFSSSGAEQPRGIIQRITAEPFGKDKRTDVYRAAAEAIVGETGITKGYALVLDAGEGRLALELARRTKLNVLGIEKDREKLTAAREKIQQAGMLGTRIAIEPWDLADLPDHFANLVVSDGALRTGKASAPTDQIARVLRPYGGVVLIGWPKSAAVPDKAKAADGLVRFVKAVATAAEKKVDDGAVWVRGERGPLRGAGSWRSLYAGAHNMACSDDHLVGPPFSVLWYGEPGPATMVERHARAQSPLAINGRLFIQGEEIVTGVDAYNGTILWKRRIPGAVRVRVDVDGGNMAVTEDALYVAAEDKCYRLDPATGHIITVYTLPPSPDGSTRRWGYIGCVDGTIVGSAAMPTKMDYAEIWDALVTEDGQWCETCDVLPRYASHLRQMRSIYPVPNELARAKMQRDGTHWRPIANFPSWGSERSPDHRLTPNVMSSDAVFAIDAASGRRKWIHRGKQIPQITVTVADGTVFLAECALSDAQKAEARKAEEEAVRRGAYRVGEEVTLAKGYDDVRLLHALDLSTGEPMWTKPLVVTGCGGDKMGMAYHDGLLFCLGHFSNHDRGLFAENRLRWRRITAVDAKTGQLTWSRPLNYLRRPVVLDDQIIIEPRACDLRTGEIKTRKHPITGMTVPWEFLRPGHSCGITSASPSAIYYRSYTSAIVDLETDTGMALFGAIRPGCWLNLISANGLLTMPEASAGCTCSFPIRCSVALNPREKDNVWRGWSILITHGPETPVRHLAVNFGAPGDRRAEDGTTWLAYPRPPNSYTKAVRLPFDDTVLDGMPPHCNDYRGVHIAGTDKPWLFTSGHLGMTSCSLPLIDEVFWDGPGQFKVRLGFAAPEGDRPGRRVFDVKIQDETVLKDFDIVAEAGGCRRAIHREFTIRGVLDRLRIALVPKVEKPTPEQAPLIACLQVIREDTPPGAPDPSPKNVGGDQAKKLIAEAEKKLAAKQSDEALELYHAVFDGNEGFAVRRAALEGMAKIGSLRSILRVATYCRKANPVIHDYQPVPSDLRAAALRGLAAIACNLAGDEKDRALGMLRYAWARAGADLETRERIAAALEDQGVSVDGKPHAQGYVTRWRLLGPVPMDAKKNPLTKPLIGEPRIDPDRDARVGGKTLAWRPLTTDSSKVVLDRIFPDATNKAVYALARVTLDRAQDLLVKVGSDDGFVCWVNGERVGEFLDGRPYKADADVCRVRVRKGTNTILIKVGNIVPKRGETNDWLFSVRLTDPAGRPVAFEQES